MPAPYAVSSDLVSAWPAKSLDVAQYIDNYLPLLAMPQNAQTGTTYVLAATDTTKLVTLSNGSPVAVTLPLESTVAWPTGTQLRLLNLGAGLVTIAGAVGVTISGTPLTLATSRAATLVKTGTNQWTIIPYGTGSPTTATASVAAFEGTTSATYTDLATVGPSVTITTGTKALVLISSQMANTASLGLASMSFAVSGATTLAADLVRSETHRSTVDFVLRASGAYLLTGLNAGSNTFTAKYLRVSAGTSNFNDRSISVIDMGS